MTERALVTGATGLLGRALSRRLVRHGWEVTATRRASSNVSGLTDLGIEFVRADVLDREAVFDAIEGHDYVFHLAGVGLMDAQDRAVVRINVEGTRNVLDGCRRHGVDRVLFTSTAGTRRSETGPATETDLADPIGTYQRSKRQAEKLVDDYAGRRGDAVTVHPTSVFGPGDEKFTAKLLTLLTRPIPVYLPGGVSVVNVEDVAAGIVSAVTDGTSGEHYILGGENLTFGETLAVLAEESDGSAPPIRVPPWCIHAAGPVVGTVNGILGTRMFPVNAEMAGCRRPTCSTPLRRRSGNSITPGDRWGTTRRAPSNGGTTVERANRRRDAPSREERRSARTREDPRTAHHSRRSTYS